MKIAFQIQLIVSAVFFFGLGCTSDDPMPASKDKITGTWIEKNPELFDGVSDTIVFTGLFITSSTG